MHVVCDLKEKPKFQEASTYDEKQSIRNMNEGALSPLGSPGVLIESREWLHSICIPQLHRNYQFNAFEMAFTNTGYGYWGRGSWAESLNANGEMTQTNQQTNRWMDGQTDRHDKLQNSMIQYSCVHVYNNFFPDYVFLAYLYARNITKEKVAKIT